MNVDKYQNGEHNCDVNAQRNNIVAFVISQGQRSTPAHSQCNNTCSVHRPSCICCVLKLQTHLAHLTCLQRCLGDGVNCSGLRLHCFFLFVCLFFCFTFFNPCRYFCRVSILFFCFCTGARVLCSRRKEAVLAYGSHKI